MQTITRENVQIEYYDSPGEFADAMRPYANVPSFFQECNTPEKTAALIETCVRGDLSNVKAAELLIDKITTKVETSRNLWAPSVCGAYPIVPEYLAGHPQCMRRRAHTASESAPIRLWVDLSASAGINAEPIAKRGVAFIALAMLLARSRPVEISAVIPIGCNKPMMAVVKLPTAPLDISLVSAAFTQSLPRAMFYRYVETLGTDDNWLRGLHPMDADGLIAYNKAIRQLLLANDEDVFVGPVYLTDESIKNPVAFVQKMIDKYGRDDNAAA